MPGRRRRVQVLARHRLASKVAGARHGAAGTSRPLSASLKVGRRQRLLTRAGPSGWTAQYILSLRDLVFKKKSNLNTRVLENRQEFEHQLLCSCSSHDTVQRLRVALWRALVRLKLESIVHTP